MLFHFSQINLLISKNDLKKYNYGKTSFLYVFDVNPFSKRTKSIKFKNILKAIFVEFASFFFSSEQVFLFFFHSCRSHLPVKT
jgi:hypothetical protein